MKLDENLPKVSVIIPIYNGEKKLRRCLTSVRTQNYNNIEVLLINDGSTDKSSEICHEFSNQDERFIVVDKKNEGVSASRNKGIEMASGEMIQFVDCDDYVEKTYLMELVDKMLSDGSDMVISGYTRHKNEKESNRRPKSETIKINELTTFFWKLYNNWFINTPWNKLYKKELIQSGYPLELNLGEDLIFNLDYIKNCNQISVIASCGYHYCIEDGNSLALQFRKDKFENSCYLHNKIVEFAKEVLKIENELEIEDKSFIKQIRFAMKGISKADNFSKAEKIKSIGEWCERNDVRKAYKLAGKLSLVDCMMKFLVKMRAKKLLFYITKKM